MNFSNQLVGSISRNFLIVLIKKKQWYLHTNVITQMIDRFTLNPHQSIKLNSSVKAVGLKQSVKEKILGDDSLARIDIGNSIARAVSVAKIYDVDENPKQI